MLFTTTRTRKGIGLLYLSFRPRWRWRFAPSAYLYARPNAITELFDSEPVPNVGTVLPLEDVRIAHEMLPPARIAAERSIEALKLPRVLLI